MAQKISREEEAKIPQFHSHEEAKAWFEDRYGEDFILTGTEYLGQEQEKCYFYYLILDWKEYMKGLKEVRINHNMAAGLDFLYSHQPVQIMENGSIHIVH